MAVVIGRVGRLLGRTPVAVSEIGLEAEDGSDLLGFGGLVEVPGPVHVAVVGDGQAVHAEPLDVLDELGDPVRAVEQRVFAVGMKMDEAHGRDPPRAASGPPVFAITRPGSGRGTPSGDVVVWVSPVCRRLPAGVLPVNID